ncbi:HDR155Wp [Eremothecium sinecaudum]|uniref:Nuclear fusion protein KAR5 n=1 Tax=Eremothecium sinecaudum TaxID=45286 RepID=A0A109UZ72_9SACH|nr:HDR155Wp [Eremothecium sinecaudum]AMD20897.1 HDR155Wp [Eremothecium sinecaudum]
MRAFFLVIPVVACVADNSQLTSHLNQAIQVKTDFHSISNDIILEKFPILESRCVQGALSQFLPKCLKYGIETITTEERTQAAVKLSVCELHASNVKNIPLECTQGSDIPICLKRLQNSPQWWTTYSGYYQRLPSICFENALPYEKEQILELFLNITDLYSNFNEKLQYSLQKYRDEFEASAEESINMMKSQVMESAKDMINELADNLAGVEQKVDVISKSVEAHTDELRNMLNDISEELNDQAIADQVSELKESTVKGWIDLHNQFNIYREVQQGYLEDVDLVFESFFGSTSRKIEEVRDAVVDNQLETIAMINDFNGLVRNSIMPMIVEELTPGIEKASEVIISKLAAIDNVVDEKVENLDSQLNDVFSSIEIHLNDTKERVDTMNESIGVLQQRVSAILSFGNATVESIAWVYRFIKKILGGYSILMAVIAPITFYLSRKLYQPSAYIVMKSAVVCSAAILGAKSGSLFFS